MSDVLSDAKALYADSLEAMWRQRLQIEEDLRFSDPSDPQQWEEDVKRKRELDPGGRRPCLNLDQTGQFVSNVAGQVESAPPSVHAIPVSGGAEKQAAEQIDGRFRHIEHASRAIQHYARAATSAARVGVGYLTVRPEYVDRALGWQEPRIGSEPDPLKVILDPWSTETDGSDATFGYVLTSLSIAEFERRWPKKDIVDFGDTHSNRRDDSRKSILLAEQWYREETTTNMIVHTGADGEDTALPEDQFWESFKTGNIPPQAQDPRSYKDKKMSVKWRRMSGADVLEDSEYQADGIGIIPVYGYVSFSEGRMHYCGIPRRARVAQQAYNYHKSELMMPGAQLIASKRAMLGVEALWDKAQTERRAYMPYNDIDDQGAIAQPSMIKVGSQLVDHAGGAESALRDIQAAIGMYQANLGAPSNEQSGVAIESRKQQGEASTAHFPSHMSASIGRLGDIVMQMDRRLTDERRTQPIMGFDRSAGSVTVDPKQKEAFSRGPDGVSINPNVGKYSVMVVAGASYSTQRTQTNSAFAEIMRNNPELAQTVAPFWAQTLDFPGSDKFAQAMAAMAPPPVKAILQPEGNDKAPDPAKLAQELDQCKQALNEAIQHARDAQGDADQAIAAAADAKRVGDAKEEEAKINWFKAETDRLKVTGANEEQMQVIVRSMLEQMLMSPNPFPGDPQSDDGQPAPAPAPQPMQPAAQEAPQEAAEPQPETQEPASMPEPQAQPPSGQGMQP